MGFSQDLKTHFSWAIKLLFLGTKHQFGKTCPNNPCLFIKLHSILVIYSNSASKATALLKKSIVIIPVPKHYLCFHLGAFQESPFCLFSTLWCWFNAPLCSGSDTEFALRSTVINSVPQVLWKDLGPDPSFTSIPSAPRFCHSPPPSHRILLSDGSCCHRPLTMFLAAIAGVSC